MSLLPFEPCSSICLSGQTDSRKSQWVYRLLKNVNNMYSGEPPVQIFNCYSIYQPLFDEIERTIPKFICKQGLPTVEELNDFTRDQRYNQGTHHRCVSVIMITQNLYPRGKHARTIALNIW